MITERDDLKTLAACTLTVPLTWLVFLGWTPGHSVMGHDALLFTLPLASRLFQEGASFENFVYTPLSMGGTFLHGAFGTVPLLEYLGKLGFSPVAALNGVVFAFQILFAFLGSRLALDLAARIRIAEPARESEASAWAVRVGLAWLLAFTPTLGWKMYYGHQTLALGTLSLFAGASVALAATQHRLTRVQIAVALVALVLSFTSMGQQSVVYGAIFGAPLLIALLWTGLTSSTGQADTTGAQKLRALLRACVVPLALLAAAILMVWPRLAPMIRYALGDDASRSLTGEGITYSYIKAVLWDWVSCLPWSTSVIASGRDSFLEHEVNYPFGPILLGFALVPWRRFRALAVGLALTALIPMLFSMHSAPFSTVWLAVFPVLKSFRVPERAMLPFMLSLPAVVAAAWLALAPQPAAAGLGKRAKQAERKSAAPVGFLVLGLALGIVLFAVPVELRELLTWLGMIGLLIVHFRGGRWAIPPAVPLLAFGLASVSAFSERKLEFSNLADALSQSARVRQAILAQEPSLASPLVRANLGINVNFAGANLNLDLGIASLDGYGSPTRRYGELISALEGHAFNATANFYQLGSSPAFAFLRPLYNVGFGIARDAATGTMQMSRLGPTAGPAWFSRAIVPVDSYEALAQRLKAAGGNLSEDVKRQAWVVASDAHAGPAIAENAVCAAAEVRSTLVENHGARFRLAVQSAASCPLTIASNYGTDFVAHATVGGAAQAIATFPAYGALLGLRVPAGASEVVVEMVPLVSTFAWVVCLFGWVLAGAVIFLGGRQRRSTF